MTDTFLDTYEMTVPAFTLAWSDMLASLDSEARPASEEN